MGVYGNYYLKRAIVVQVRLGANLPRMRSTRSILVTRPEGRSTAPTGVGSTSPRVIHHPNAFCSITLYDAEGFQIANPLNRFAVSIWMPFSTMPADRATFTCKTKAWARTRKQTGSQPQKVHSI
jgi:hypothetical protein